MTLIRKRISTLVSLALLVSTLTFFSVQTSSAGVPAAARLIGNGGNSRTILNPNSVANFASCASSTGIRGITSDGTYVYYRPSGNATIICKTTLSGTFVSANTVINSGQTRTFQNYSSESRALTYANGCILFRGGENASTDKGYAANSDIMCVDSTNWTMYGPFTPTGGGIPLGGFWLTSNIMNFPDGRVGAVSAPNAGVGTGPACSASYCKYLRLYNVTRTGNSLTFAFDRDITLADSESGWPDDDHGMATDGTYLYQIKYNSGYKVWQLSNTVASTIVFNGSGSGSCGAATDTSGGMCNINTSVGWASGANATFFGRSHATNQYIMGDYAGYSRFWTSDSVAPPAGIGSDVTAPVLSAQSASSVTQTTATLNFTSGEAGTYYYLVYASASSAPDTSTIISQGASLPTIVKGTSSATASANTVAVTGLSAGTAYKAYVVVKDSSGNVSLVSMISLTTAVANPAFTLSASSETRTYGTSGAAFTPTSTGGLIASYSISATPAGMSFDTSTGVLTGAPTTIAAATTYTVTATNASGTATQNFVLTVATRPITIKAAAKSATYTGSSVSLSNSYSITSGTLASTDTFTALTYTYTSTPLSYNSATAPTSAGSYTITPSAASFSVGSASNYSITYDTATLTIEVAAQSALTLSSISGVYGTTLKLITTGGSGTGAVSYSTGTAGCTVTNTDSLTVTSALTCSVTATKAADSNYSVISSSATNVVFSARPFTIKAADKTATYNGTPASITNSYSITSGTLVGSETFTALTYTYTSSSSNTITSSNLNVNLDATSSSSANVGLQTWTSITPASSSITSTSMNAGIVATNGNSPGYINLSTLSSYVNMGNNAATNIAGDISMDTWIKITNYHSGNSWNIIATRWFDEDGSGQSVQDWHFAIVNNRLQLNTAGNNAQEAIMGSRTFSAADQNQWMHVGMTLNNTTCTVQFYINGVADGASLTNAANCHTGGSSATPRLFLGDKRGCCSLQGYISKFRLYSAQLTATQMKANYDADAPTYGFTEYNSTTAPTNAGSYTITPSAASFSVGSASNYSITYETANLTIYKANQGALTITTTTSKYGTPLRLVTSGGSGTGALSFAIASAGTASGCAITNETITVTSFGTCNVTATKALDTNYFVKYSETTTITFAKADTITVTTTLSSNTVTYTESPAAITTTQTVTGLVNSETATVTTTYTGNSCEYGGTCAIGNVAPGGGYVFYVSPTVINVATGISSGGIYLATAPQTWGGGSIDPNASFGCGSTNIASTSDSVGSGAENTRLINAGCATAGIASRLAADSSAEGFTDWFIPSIDELTLIYNNLKLNSLSNLQSWNYWSSTQGTTLSYGKYWWFGSGAVSGQTDKNNSAASNMYVRPIRAFSPTALASATVPTDAGVYKVGSTFAISSPASLSNYQGVESVTATLTINKANQRAITIGQYLAYPNISSYPLNVYGGSGPGVLTRTLVSAGTAGCSLASSFILTATSVGSCTVKAEKAGTRNYIVESTTATIYWIAWLDNYAAQTLGGNNVIPLAGGNQIIVRTETLTASAFSNTSGGAITSAAVGATIRINSTGFSGLSPSDLSVTFRPYEDAVVSAVTSTYVEVVIPAGATTGVIAIDSPRGVAYTQSFTISP